ncbi:hypothetical protein CPB84DRAFT_1905355 [Gymnopilus junonius]|uniref:LysM domain-containing protein n=1 Tax=Gymnopilus junonius TaxID=109634 RepID=A0A9P5TPL0_GYMJU|nr:hypothetical protein CPB84DRAFT_1905355 [Gymnopilus junonius]
MSYDDPDDPRYNPFAEEQSSISNHAQPGYYSSAFFPTLSNTQPTLRRRRSSLTARSLKDEDEWSRPKHARTRTEIQIIPHSPIVHPLKSALAGINGAVFPDLGITRPHLSRILNDSVLFDTSESVEDSLAVITPPSPDQEKDVIVHQVSSTDSLAGVALKYGISLPNLRRANKLWANDSIHLRDVLYIPIDQASRAHEYIPEPTLSSFTPAATSSSSHSFHHFSTDEPAINCENPEIVVPSPMVPIRRIPVKQLSYFPPSTSRNTELELSSRVETPNMYLQSPAASKLPPQYNRYSPSPVNNSLSSILTALPIAASTRDEIITRLSFDSVSSSFSDRSRANSDEEVGHELNDVTKPRRLPDPDHDSDTEYDDELSMPTPKATQRLPDVLLPSQAEPAILLSSSLPKYSHARSYSSTSPPRFYVSQVNQTYVRTSQMEPSPAMQLPNFQSSTLGRSAGKSRSGHANADTVIRSNVKGKERSTAVHHSSFDLG